MIAHVGCCPCVNCELLRVRADLATSDRELAEAGTKHDREIAEFEAAFDIVSAERDQARAALAEKEREAEAGRTKLWRAIAERDRLGAKLAAAQEEAKGLRMAHAEIVQRWQRAQWCVLCDHYVCTSDCPVSISTSALAARQQQPDGKPDPAPVARFLCRNMFGCQLADEEGTPDGSCDKAGKCLLETRPRGTADDARPPSPSGINQESGAGEDELSDEAFTVTKVARCVDCVQHHESGGIRRGDTVRACGVCGRDTVFYVRFVMPAATPPSPASPTETLGPLCEHGLYKSRCERCGAEPLNANVASPTGETRDDGKADCNCGSATWEHRFGDPGCEYENHHCGLCHERRLCTAHHWPGPASAPGGAPGVETACGKGDHCFVDNPEPAPEDPFACKHCGETAEVCEGCPEPATRRDVEGVPLCKGCYDALDDASSAGEANGTGTTPPPAPRRRRGGHERRDERSDDGPRVPTRQHARQCFPWQRCWNLRGLRSPALPRDLAPSPPATGAAPMPWLHAPVAT